MKKLCLLILFCVINFSLLAQSNSNTEANPKNKSGFLFIPKLGFAKTDESGYAPLYVFVAGVDGLYSREIWKETCLQTGLGYFEFYGNRNINGNSAALKNAYLQIPLKFKTYSTIFENESKDQHIYSVSGIGFYANTLLNQKIETTSDDSTEKNLGWNLGFLGQWGLKCVLSNKLNLEAGFQFQFDLSKMKKDGVERKTDFMNAIYLEFKF